MSVEEIISAIFDRSPIWNSKHMNHKNKRIINQLWEEIKNELNIEVAELKKKWKNLRDQFRKELKKVPAPRSGDAGPDHHPTWQYFEQMSFLRDEIIPLTTESNLSQNDVEDQIPNQLSYSSPENVEIEEVSTASSDINTARPQEEASTSSQLSRKRKTANDLRKEFLELEKKRVTLLEKDLEQNRIETSRDEKKSEDYHFLMSLLPQMESFTPIQKFRVRQKINQAIMEELYMYNETTFNQPNYGYNTQ